MLPTTAQYLFLLLNLEQLQNTSSQASFFSTVSWSVLNFFVRSHPLARPTYFVTRSSWSEEFANQGLHTSLHSIDKDWHYGTERRMAPWSA